MWLISHLFDFSCIARGGERYTVTLYEFGIANEDVRLETKEYVDGWIYLNMEEKWGKNNWKRVLFFFFPSKWPENTTEMTTRCRMWSFDLILTSKRSVNCFSPPPPVASAFSERYLGLPKPDPRAYAVRSDSKPSHISVMIIIVVSHLI